MNWVYVFLGFCLLIILHEAGHFLAAKATGMRVERFFLFFGPTIWSFKRGETEYGVKAIPLGGYVKITGMSPEEDVPPEHEEKAYYKQKVWKRIVVVAAGPAVNIVLAFLILFAVYTGFGRAELEQSVGEVRANSAAAEVLRPGDRILAVDGKAFPGLGIEDRLKRFGDEVKSHECAGKPTNGCIATTPVRLRIERGGEVRNLSVRPRYDAEEKRSLIGFSYGTQTVDVPPGAAISEAGDSIWEVAQRTVHIISHLFESKERNQVSGVVGISAVAHEQIGSGEHGFERGLLLLALVSLSLGLINLLPILPLDGGHIFWAVVEKLRGGKPVSLRVMERATVIGILLVVMLALIGLGNDIGRITGEGFQVR